MWRASRGPDPERPGGELGGTLEEVTPCHTNDSPAGVFEELTPLDVAEKYVAIGAVMVALVFVDGSGKRILEIRTQRPATAVDRCRLVHDETVDSRRLQLKPHHGLGARVDPLAKPLERPRARSGPSPCAVSAHGLGEPPLYR